MSAPGRPKREYLSAQHEGEPSAKGRSERESLPLGGKSRGVREAAVECTQTEAGCKSA